MIEMLTNFIFPISLIFLAGWLFISLLKVKNKSFALNLAVSWCLGTLILPLQMYMYSILGMSWSFANIILPWIIISFLYLFYKKPNLKTSFPNLSAIQKFVVLIYLIIFITTAIEATLLPITSWDAVASWYLGGKAFHLDGYLNPSFINYADNSTPPLFNLLITFMFGFGVNDANASIIYPIFLISSGIIVYNILKQYLKPNVSALASMLFILTPNLMRHGGRYDVGYADLPLAFYFLVSIYFLYLFIKQTNLTSLAILVFTAASASLVRSEGLPFFILVIIVVLPILYRKKLFSGIWLILAGILLVFTWTFQVYFLSLPINPFIQSLPDLSRTPFILFEFGKEMLNIFRWNFLWVAFLLIVPFAFGVKKNYFEKAILTIFFFQLSVYALVYTMTNLDFTSHINNSFDRLLIHISGVGFLIISIIVAKKFTKSFLNF